MWEGSVGERYAGGGYGDLLGSSGEIFPHLGWAGEACVLGEESISLCYSVECPLLVVPVIREEALDCTMGCAFKCEGVKFIPFLVYWTLFPAFVVLGVVYNQGCAVGRSIIGENFFTAIVCTGQGFEYMSDCGSLVATEE